MSLKKLLSKRSDDGKMRGATALKTGLKKDALDFGREYSNKLTYDDLINAESELGRTLFGPIPAGHRREFFWHRNNVWIWHESWLDAAGVTQGATIRYEVRPAGVYKKPLGGEYEMLEGHELENFVKAAERYSTLVRSELYS